jgi:hypothetical protein
VRDGGVECFLPLEALTDWAGVGAPDALIAFGDAVVAHAARVGGLAADGVG